MYCSPVHKKCYPQRERYWGCAWHQDPLLQLSHLYYSGFAYANHSATEQAFGRMLRAPGNITDMHRGGCCVSDSNCDQTREAGPMVCHPAPAPEIENSAMPGVDKRGAHH